MPSISLQFSCLTTRFALSCTRLVLTHSTSKHIIQMLVLKELKRVCDDLERGNRNLALATAVNQQRSVPAPAPPPPPQPRIDTTVPARPPVAPRSTVTPPVRKVTSLPKKPLLCHEDSLVEPDEQLRPPVAAMTSAQNLSLKPPGSLSQSSPPRSRTPARSRENRISDLTASTLPTAVAEADEEDSQYSADPDHQRLHQDITFLTRRSV